MKAKDKKELPTKTIAELRTALQDARKILFDLRMATVQQKLKNTRSLFVKRKEIATILTVLREKERKRE